MLLTAWNTSSLVIDSLCDQGWGEHIVAGLYCDFFIQQEQTVTNMMGAILKQLLRRVDIPGYLGATFREGKRKFGYRGLRLQGMMEMLKITIASLPQVFICIDALDECLPKNLPELLESLGDIVRESPKTRIFLTGRPHIINDIRIYFPKVVVITITPNMDGLRSYLEMRLDNDPQLEAMNDDLRADILRVILARKSDMCVRVSRISALTKMFTHQLSCVDSFLFHSTSTLF